MGGQYQFCDVRNCVTDEVRKLVTTSAYMLTGTISEATAGLSELVTEVCG